MATAVDVTAALNTLETEITTALSDLSTALSAGTANDAAALDGVVTQIGTLQTQVLAGIAAVPVPTAPAPTDPVQAAPVVPPTSP